MRKRCTGCGFECALVEAEAYFYRRRHRGDGFQPRCKECDKARCRSERAKHPERWAAYERSKWYRIREDPERLGVARAHGREYMRRVRGTPPERFQDAEPQGHVSAAIVREAVERSGVPVTEVSRAAGYEPSTVGKALKRDTIRAGMAKRILAAIDVLPAEVEL